jgi:hypothetical protein
LLKIFRNVIYNINAYIQKTIDATSISERSIRRIRKEKSDTGMLLSPPKMRNLEPLKPVDDFDICAIRNKIHEFYTVRRQLPTIAKLASCLKYFETLYTISLDCEIRIFPCLRHVAKAKSISKMILKIFAPISFEKEPANIVL